jgi:hypothetical protein
MEVEIDDLDGQFTEEEIAELQPQQHVVKLMDLMRSVQDKVPLVIGTNDNTKPLVLRPHIEEIPFENLYIEEAYQRNPNIPQIRMIVSDFCEDAAGLPLVIRRLYNGSEMVVVDSQQRLLAAAIRGYRAALCVVITSMCLEDEARIFGRINLNRRRVPTPVTHRNKLIERDDKSLQLQRVILDAGYKITEKEGNRAIKGVTRLHSSAATYGYDGLRDPLLAYSAIWPGHKTVHLYLLSGLVMLNWTYANPNSPTYDPGTIELVSRDRLASRLAKVFPTYREAVDATLPMKGTLKVTTREISGSRPNDTHRLLNDLFYASNLIKGYNRGLRSTQTKLSESRLYESYLHLSHHGSRGEVEPDEVDDGSGGSAGVDMSIFDIAAK